jgi:hypothetical protein
MARLPAFAGLQLRLSLPQRVSIHDCLPEIAMAPTAHEGDSDSAVFRVPHVLFQQRSAPSICNCKTAETVWRYEAELAKLTRNFHWHWRRIPLRIRSGPELAQPVEILRCQVRMRGSPLGSSDPFNPRCLQFKSGG